MKVKFNVPSARFSSHISFDNNTTFGVGNVQPLFCKYVLPKSKFSCSFNQLTRLSPLVVPSFARLKQLNDFVFVNINKVMPSFDAFMSNTPISGTAKTYTPQSLPCVSNKLLFLNLVSHYSWLVTKLTATDALSPAATVSALGSDFTISTNSHVPSLDDYNKVAFDFEIPVNKGAGHAKIKLTQDGRYWYSLLRGLGYSLDFDDDKPVSILPLWAFYKAYYDLYYPKRYNPWHQSNAYSAINSFYNGSFQDFSFAGHHFDVIKRLDLLRGLFGSDFVFAYYGVLDNDLINSCLANPINQSSPDASSLDAPFGTLTSSSDDVDGVQSNVPGVFLSNGTTSASSLSLAQRLWSFVSRSSVVGQSVKDWFKVHFGTSPSEDMFDASVCFASKTNFIGINTVVSNADTAASNGAQLGDLAGQAFAQTNDKVSFDVPQFGFIMCLSAIVPMSRISGGTQPELYNVGYFNQPFPDFDGLGYEVINKSSIVDNSLFGRYLYTDYSSGINSGFGYVPRFSSFKFLNNYRSGGFAIPSIKDSYLSYCEDTVIRTDGVDVAGLPDASDLKVFTPWRYPANFESYNRIFYNQHSYDAITENDFVDDNFLCQSAFEFDISSYLKPISDSYSIERLGNQVLSVKRQ